MDFGHRVAHRAPKVIAGDIEARFRTEAADGSDVVPGVLPDETETFMDATAPIAGICCGTATSTDRAAARGACQRRAVFCNATLRFALARRDAGLARSVSVTRKDKLLLDQAMGPALLTLSLVTGSIRPPAIKLSRVIEALLLTTCVVSGAVGVVGVLA